MVIVIVAVISAPIFASSILSRENDTFSQNATTTCIASPASLAVTTSGAPCLSSPTCVPGGESGPFGLRILFDSNRTPVVGAEVVATNQPLMAGCVGSPAYPMTTQMTATFTTNGTDWYSFESGYDASYSVIVTYLGQSYNLTATFRPEYAYCATLFVPSGATNVTGTEFQESCSSSSANTGAFSG